MIPQDDAATQALLDHVSSFAPNYYAEVRNPQWSSADKLHINCEVNFHHVPFEEWTPFTANKDDYMPYSKQIFDECVAGKYGPIADYVDPVLAVPDAPSVQMGIVI